ncbi:MAG: FTR1 family protein [Chloroflexi bacterium]|nr:FTR1 family protein [Chloroflexota bacterium]
MLPSYLLSLREGIEAALIVGILLGAVRQIRRPELASAVWFGALSASLLSILTAVLLTIFGLEMEGPAEEIFEGFTMLIAAGLLTWMIFWMSRQARSLKSNLEAEIHQASQIGRRAIFFVAFIAVLREGIELALFLTASVFISNSLQTMVGAFLGLGTAILLGWSIFASTIRLDLRRFFQVTGILLILFAAGLFAHGVHEFTEVGWIPAIIEHVWDMNSLISKESIPGQLLGALFGYNPTPSLAELIAYIAYFAAIGIGLQWSGQRYGKETTVKA